MTLRPEPYRHLEQGDMFRRLASLEAEASARGVSMSTLALAWVLRHPRVDAAVIGPRNAEHLKDALQAADLAPGAIRQTTHPDMPQGQVTDQTPSAGTPLPGGRAVDVTISTGPSLVLVPELVGLNQVEAADRLPHPVDRHIVERHG